MSPSTVDRPGRLTRARTTTKATTIAMTSATTPRAGPSVAVDPSRSCTSGRSPPIAPDGAAGGCRSDPTQAAQEIEHQEEDHPEQGSRQDEDRGRGQDERSDDPGSASHGIGQRDTQDQREWHRDGEQTCHDSDQDAAPHSPVCPLYARAPEIRQSGEPDA